MKIFEMFSGYGGASFSLKKSGIEYEVVGYSEIDKYAIQCYEQNHKGKNFGDCKNINPEELPDFDLLTGGFPCQSFSVAGKGLGEQDTRGTLFHEIIRIAEVKKPKYILLENVKGLTFKPHNNNLRILSPKIFQYRLRKLTPKECFRLMGFLDDGINLDNLSNNQKYKLAGNGWDINLVSKIFKKMFK